MSEEEKKKKKKDKGLGSCSSVKGTEHMKSLEAHQMMWSCLQSGRNKVGHAESTNSFPGGQ